MFTLLSSCSLLHSTPLSHSLFRERFTRLSEIYKRLGQFDYDQPNYTTDHIKTCIRNDDRHYNWIYIGEVKEGTGNTPHGIGIRVEWYDMGRVTIEEGYWKNGSLHGRGREIRGNSEKPDSVYYYIGDYKGGSRHGQGIEYRRNIYWDCGKDWDDNGDRYEGDDRYEGGWKDGKRHGQGTYYRYEGYLFTGNDDWKWLGEINDKEWTKYTGQWDGWKGIGEINYYGRKKYIGEWGDYGRKHGQGTLYSAYGKVLNNGRWEEDIYVGIGYY